MKRLFLALSVVLVLALSVVPAFAAAEGEGETSSVPVTVNTPVNVTVEDNEPIVFITTDAASAIRSQLIATMTSIFGEYTPRTQTVTTIFADGTSTVSTQVVPGVAGMDWVWISGVLLFTLVLYCILRMIGGIFRWK